MAMIQFEISNVKEYVEFINNNEHQHIAQWFYRGHGNSDFELTPGLFRINNNDAYADWDRIEKYMMTQFKNESLPFLKTIPNDETEWLTIAQHYGLPTRLLDWTTNPLVALFFAVEKFEQVCQANVWMYGVVSVNNCWPESTWMAKKIGLSGDTCKNVIFPKHIDARITNQSGCFTIHESPQRGEKFTPFDQQKDIFSSFIKINISTKNKGNYIADWTS